MVGSNKRDFLISASTHRILLRLADDVSAASAVDQVRGAALASGGVERLIDGTLVLAAFVVATLEIRSAVLGVGNSRSSWHVAAYLRLIVKFLGKKQIRRHKYFS